MKTIVNKIRVALVLGFLALGMTVLAQEIANVEKMSMSTLMFLDEMAGKVSFDAPAPVLRSGSPELMREGVHQQRPIAKPDTIDGELYISAFIRVTDDHYITDLERLGVKIMCTFENGLMTANIPINKIAEVAAIEGVKQIEVAELMEPETDLARQATNVDDVLTLSQDAALAGLQQKYDGSGVILAVIDNGIDFQHIAFKDKNGNPRIKRAYKYDGSSTTEYTGTGALPTADATTSDHGTHTSSIAGGSSVIVNGTNVTVTDDHSAATYGGMAPGADLYLAGISGLNNTYITNAFQKIVEYAEQEGKPLVVSNSYSNSYGPRDGYYGGSTEEVIKQYFGESHPDRICLFATANRAGNADPDEGGGLYATGTASSSNPLASILRCNYYTNTDCGYYYYGTLVDAWARNTSSGNLACKIYVLDSSTGAILSTQTVTKPNNSSSTTVDLSSYYGGTFTAYWATNSTTNKKQFRLYCSGGRTTSRQSVTGGYTSDYTLAVEVYPTSGSSIIDMWGGGNCYFTDYLTTSGHNWVKGSDDISVSDHAVMPEVISVGSYVTRGGYNDDSIGDISSFSGYAVEGVGPLGTMQPWISAPGQVIVSAFNHSRTDRSSDPLVNNASNPYGTSQGTSMATPCAAGIVALWLQAASEVGKSLTLSEVKQIMKETAIRDYWVTEGPNASHFGNGKINALAGIEYILSHYAVPSITASPREVTLTAAPGTTASQTVTVGSIMLTGDIVATLNDPNGVYSINTTNLGQGGNLVITFNPSEIGNYSATVTLTSNGVDPVTITINGSATIQTDATICDDNATNATLPVYGYNYDYAQTNQMLYPSDKFTGTGMSGNKIKKITFYPTNGTYNGTTYSGINFYRNNNGTGTVTVKLANMPSGTTGYSATATRKDADFVTVKTITMPTSAQTSLTEWVFEDLENDFTYTGGDLLIEVVTTVGQWGRTFFAGENQDTYTSYYSYRSSYSSTSTGQMFLPKVNFEWDAPVPVIAGAVSPSELTFSDVFIGKQDNKAVTITNTGNQAFTPIIDTTNLPSVFAVTGNGQVLPGGSLDLTVTYLPTDEGPHSGSFTVTIGGQTYTVTVTGNGIVVNTTLVSNAVVVPAYHSEVEASGDYVFSQEEVNGDRDMSLQYDEAHSDVKFLVKNEEAISRYDLHHKVGNDGEWALVGNANHQGDSYVYNNTTMTFGNGETEMWFPMKDWNAGDGTVTYYVPVTVADGVITTDNTYGAPIRSVDDDNVNLTVIVGGSKSDKRTGGHWTNPTDSVEYCVYTTIVEIISDELDGVTHKPYMYRAWVTTLGDHPIYNFDRNDKGAIVGTTTLDTPYLLGELELHEGEYGQHIVIGEEWDPNSGIVKLQNAFGAPSYGAQISVIVRAYYQPAEDPTMLRAAGEGMYAFSQSGGDTPFDLPTGMMEIVGIKQVVDVTYVNAMGMQSSRPFEGLNIVVTRYSDGSVTTMKVIK